MSPSPPNGSSTNKANVSAEYISRIQTNIRELEQKIAELTLQRDGLDAQLSNAMARYAAIGRLPSELLAHIFTLAVHGEGRGWETLGSLVRVCRYFRMVACSTPFLWTTVRITAECKWDVVRLYFDLSRNLPLDVSIHFDDFPHSLPRSAIGEALLDAMDVLQPVFFRLRTFRLYVLNEALAYAALLRTQRHRAPLLERFTVRVAETRLDLHEALPTFRIFNADTPRLQIMTLQSIRFNGGLPVTDQLRSLHLSGYHVFEGVPSSVILNVMRSCRKLETVQLENMDDYRHEPSDTSSILLPRLTTLGFASCGVLRAHHLLQILIIPRLERLELANLNEITTLLRGLDTKAERMPLRFIRIETCLFNELRLMHMFMKWTGIESMELVDCEDVSDNLLRGLSEPPASQLWILPHLRNVVLEGCTTLSDAELRRFVKSRVEVPLNKDISAPDRLQTIDLTRASVSTSTRAWLDARLTVFG